nr:ATP-binding protein [Streptomyces qinzhouensis]
MSTSATEFPVTVRVFSQRLICSPRGARWARVLTRDHLRDWEVPHDPAERAEQVVAELASNAVRHARVPGRGFKLRLKLDRVAGVMRVEVTDARGERLPAVPHQDMDGESGRGLLLVVALADRWGWEPYAPSGKTVWAEIDLQTLPTRA